MASGDNAMQSGSPPSGASLLTAEAIQEQAQRILSSQRFASADRLRNFLRFIIGKALDGKAGEVKEYLIAIEVYGRKPDYDPKIDSIVRVEASRLRSRLREYYEAEGRTDPILVELPKGSYVPSFRANLRDLALPPEPPVNPAKESVTELPAPAASLPAPRPKTWLWVAAAFLLILAALAVWPRLRSQPAKLSIAVLPFANLTLDPKNDVLVKGLAKDIESALTQSGGLRVLSGASPQQLRSDLLLEGSVRVDRDRFRVIVQMLQLKEGGYLWSQTYEKQSSDLFSLQSELAQAIYRDTETKGLQYSQELSAGGTPRGRALGFLRQARPRPGYDHDGMLMRGPSTYERLRLEEVNRSIALLEQAVGADPGFALAHSALASFLSVAGEYDARMIQRAKQAAFRALQLDPNLGETHLLLGHVAFLSEWDFRAAAEHLQKSTQLEPRILSGYRLYADVLTLLDRPDEALRELERGRVIYPKNPVIETEVAVVLYNSGRFDEMSRQAQQVLKQFPGFPLAHWVAGLALEQQKKYPEAIAHFEACLKLSARDGRCTVAVGHAYAKAGRRADALKISEQYRLRTNQVAAPYSRALIANALGDRASAINFLEASFDVKEQGFPYLKVEPRLANLRSDPKIAPLLRGIGL
ncbi:MAG: tetratricopeptide repeat protein [Bryobacterales bacterium]|nr:tetratricopeptide repeat protein [Bryobacterales bacterium]